MAVIVVEGPDESGKTTLANHLGIAYDAPVDHSPVKGGEWLGIWNSWTNYRITNRRLNIADRCPEISEAVYGIDRGSIRYPFWFRREWLNQPIFLVFCLPNQFTYPKSLHRDVENNVVNHEGIYERYKTLYEVYYSYGIPSVRYHWSMPDTFIKNIEGTLDHWIERNSYT